MSTKGTPKSRESLLMKRVLLELDKKVRELAQTKFLFINICKSKGKCFKVVIDSSSTYNLVSIQMVEKIDLKRISHHASYKVSWLQKEDNFLVNE